MTDLKIFEMPLGWKGFIIVVARNAQDAIEIMKKYPNFPEDYDGEIENWINCLEIGEGLTIFDSGDYT